MQTMMMMKKLALALALGVAVSPAIAAGGLGVEATHAVGTRGAFAFTIANDGSQALAGVRWHALAGYAVQCAPQTTGGRGFTLDGVLQPGDRAACTMAPSSAVATHPRSAAVMVSARGADGVVSVRHAGIGLLGVTTPAQGAVVVIGGSVHADSDLDGQLDAGETIAYDYTVVNAGTQALAGLALSDITGAVGCPATTLAVDATMTCTSSYTISAGDATAGLVLDEVDVTGAADGGQAVQAADLILSLNLSGTAAIRVFKSPLLLDDADASGYASAGDVLGYTFLVKNSNQQSLASVDLVEPDPTLIDGPITCAPVTLVGGQVFTGLGSGTLVSQDVLRCTAEHTITAAEAGAGEVLNLAEASGVAAIGGPVSGTGASAVAVGGAGQLVVTKTVNTQSATVGSTVTYTVTVRNEGSLDLQNVTISDPVPNGLEAFAWTCAGTGVTCPTGSGTGAIAESIPTFPAGAQIGFTITATVSQSAPPNVVNTVTVTPLSDVLCAPTGTPAPCSATVPLGIQQAFAVPLDGDFMRFALVGLLGAIAMSRLRRRRG